MTRLKRITKWIVSLLLIPVTYVLVSLLLSAIVIDREAEPKASDMVIFLTTNGVHLDIILPINRMENSLLTGLKYDSNDSYLAFGWGDENFYINTPTWAELTFKNAINAMFLQSSTLMHVTRYARKRSDWVEVRLNQQELAQLNSYVHNTFQLDEQGNKIILNGQGYGTYDEFYRAKGSYSCFKTCNSWVNSAFKQNGLRSCLWTPFDFGLMHAYAP